METGNTAHLSAEDRNRISEAVRSAEQRTKAEIVPMLVSRSGLYRDAQYRTGLILAFLVLACLLLLEAAWLPPWGWHASNGAWLLLLTVAAYGVGAWAGTLTPVVRFVTSTERMRQKVRARAERAFAGHGISQTRERTGVLLMLSLLERQVYVLPDREAAKRVPADQWNEVVQAIVERLQAADVTGGLCAGIERCGAILARVCPANPDDNPNEIPDRVVEED